MRLVWISVVIALLAAALWFATRRPLVAAIPHTVPQRTSGLLDQGRESVPKPINAGDRHVDTASSLRIVVAMKDDSRPVAHARVLLEKSGIDPQEWSDVVARYGSPESALAHGLGDSYETDENGELLIPLVDRRGLACAWREDLFGKTEIRPGTHDASIEMTRVRTLDIDVVDARGAPVPDVCIAALVVAGAEWDSLNGGWTDANGRVHVDDLDKAWRIGAAYGATDPAFIDVDERNPSSPIRFVLGATGDVELSLTDAN